MAAESFTNWIPIEIGDEAVQALVKASVTERVARNEPMSSNVKWVPRSGDFSINIIAKSGTYAENSTTNDKVVLTAVKVGGAERVAEEDLTDSAVDILATKRVDAMRNMALFYDNATLGCSAASDGSTVAYTSVYKAVRTSDTNANPSYTADTNYVSGSATYANLSATLAKVEDSIWFDAGNTLIIASPAFKSVFRGIVDNYGRPIFLQTVDGTPDTLFGYDVAWTQGARISATNTAKPAGNPLLIVANTQMMINGTAALSPGIANSNPGFALQRAINGIGFLSDEALMKVAMRRAFVVANANAFGVFEKTS